MNNQRQRGKTLIIVEGKHEKKYLFDRLFWGFQEMNIKQEDIIVYGTNIYVVLCQDLEQNKMGDFSN